MNDYLRVKFFAAVIELARPSRLYVAIVLGPDLQRAERGHYRRVLRRPIFEFIKCIFFAFPENAL